MSVPGSNILNQALRLIAKQTFQYKAFASRTPNGIGMWVTTYAKPVTAQGSVQAVSRQLIEFLGLDLNKEYRNIFVSQTVTDVTRDKTPDQFIFAGQTFEALSVTPWASVDGWVQVLCVKVPNAG